MIPIDSAIRDRQTDYHAALPRGVETGNATPFIEFLLNAILAASQQLTGEVTGEVKKLIRALKEPMNRTDLQEQLQLKSQANFRDRYLQPALRAGLIEMTIPDKPKSSKQKYRLTEKGKLLLNK